MMTVKRRLQIIPLEPKHAAVAPYLRRSDVREHEAVSDLPIDTAVAFSIAHSERGFAAELDGRVIAVFGVNGGVVWLVGTDEISEHPVTFFRVSKKIFERLSDGYNCLFNYVDEKNILSLRWLKWLGFKIEPAQKINNGIFHFAHWEREREKEREKERVISKCVH